MPMQPGDSPPLSTQLNNKKYKDNFRLRLGETTAVITGIVTRSLFWVSGKTDMSGMADTKVQ